MFILHSVRTYKNITLPYTLDMKQFIVRNWQCGVCFSNCGRVACFGHPLLVHGNKILLARDSSSIGRIWEKSFWKQIKTSTVQRNIATFVARSSSVTILQLLIILIPKKASFVTQKSFIIYGVVKSEHEGSVMVRVFSHHGQLITIRLLLARRLP